MKMFATTITLGALALATAGCGSSSNSSSTASSAATTSTASSVAISTRHITGLGTVLVNSQGRTIYMFAPDKQKHVTCVGSCAVVWPPVKAAGSSKAMATGGANEALIGSDADPSGGRVVTYGGWPLYTYAADTAPGVASGQDVNLNGGYW